VLETETSATSQKPVDIFVIGGGINGVGIARDAAGRGLSVMLCDRNDLANGTSSASTKLIHGGLRYLEFYEFRLVREALFEREILLNAAPHIIWPIEFILPHSQNLRPTWMVRLGLFLYDHLAKRRRLSGSYTIDLRSSRFGKPLKRFVKTGFVYSDCWVEDARLVILSAVDAAKFGATIRPHTEFIGAKWIAGMWHVTLHSKKTGIEETIFARTLVNASGPALRKVNAKIEGDAETHLEPMGLRLVKGSHIVVPRLYEGEHAYILQHSDRRMVFVIPFEEKFSLIGTTDQLVDESDPMPPKISDAEIDYLLEAVNQYFTKQLSRESISYTYSGIRPLFDDRDENNSPQSMPRDYHLELHDHCLNVYGGKITTFRRLAEEAVDMIVEDRGETDERPAWTSKAILPGGDIGESLSAFTQELLQRYDFIPETLLTRMASHYGSRLYTLLDDVSSMADMGQLLGYDLYTREVDFLCDTEWAQSTDDILYRRTKLGLHVDQQTRDALTAYLLTRSQ
jgi:glycerol-3-phosphate dehydrogenase